MSEDQKQNYKNFIKYDWLGSGLNEVVKALAFKHKDDPHKYPVIVEELKKTVEYANTKTPPSESSLRCKVRHILERERNIISVQELSKLKNDLVYERNKNTELKEKKKKLKEKQKETDEKRTELEEKRIELEKKLDEEMNKKKEIEDKKTELEKDLEKEREESQKVKEELKEFRRKVVEQKRFQKEEKIKEEKRLIEIMKMEKKAIEKEHTTIKLESTKLREIEKKKIAEEFKKEEEARKKISERDIRTEIRNFKKEYPYKSEEWSEYTDEDNDTCLKMTSKDFSFHIKVSVIPSLLTSYYRNLTKIKKAKIESQFIDAEWEKNPDSVWCFNKTFVSEKYIPSLEIAYNKFCSF